MDNHRINTQDNGKRRKQTENFRRKQHNKAASINLAKKWKSKKLALLAIFFLLFLCYFIFRIIELQGFAGDAYLVRSISQVLNRHAADDRVISPIRGTIFDRNMQSLAVSTRNYNVFVDVRMLAQRQEAELAAGRGHEVEDNRYVLTNFFGMTNAEFSNLLARNANGQLINDTNFYIIARGLNFSEVTEFENWLNNYAIEMVWNEPRQEYIARQRRIRDIHIEEDSNRSYLMGSLAAPVVGFWRGYWWGLEHYYNSYLVGTSGRVMTGFDTDGNIATQHIAPINGSNIITTIDSNIQRFAEEVTMRHTQDFSASNGSVIVMQPFTGEILAMTQYPSFDANYPADISRLTSNDLSAHLADMDHNSSQFIDYLTGVWRNFNITTAFEPGSIYKPFTIAKALEEGIIYPNQTFYCPGHKYVSGFRIHCARRWGHGLITLTQALAVSCNVAHMNIAAALGRDLFWQYQRDFGYGVLTGIDFPGEVRGNVFPLDALNDSELATSSFGQRFEATPIQSIASFASLINGGNVVRPHFVSQIVDADGFAIYSHRPHIDRRVISRDTSDWLRRTMEYVITDGTGHAAAIEGFAQGGKTATAEQGIHGSHDFTYSLSFIGYFPVEEPQYLIMVLLHNVPEEVWDAGQRSVTPMYREIAQEIIRLRGIRPTIAVPGIIHDNDEQLIENFVGQNVADVAARLNLLGLDYEFVGHFGNVVSYQFPLPGGRVTPNTRIMLSIDQVEGAGELAAVPDVVGLPVELARQVLGTYGFVSRIVYGQGFDLDYIELPQGIAPHIYSQIARGIRLPMGTEILLRARYINDDSDEQFNYHY